MKTEILRLEKVSLPPFLDEVNLHVLKGEIVGLIPINILGVEELVTLITEGLAIHYGYLTYAGKRVNDYLESQPKKNNVVIIEKDSTLIDSLSVYENLFVIRKGFSQFVIKKKMLCQQTKRILDIVGLSLDPEEIVENLSPYEKVALELIKANILHAKLVIVKDISSFLLDGDISNLHLLMKRLSNQGMSFLYICNHHQEAFLVSDRCYLMKEGHMVKNLLPQEMREDVMSHYSYVFEHSLASTERKKLYDKPPELRTVFSSSNVYFKTLENLSLSVKTGETVVLLDSDNSIVESFSQLLKGEEEQTSGFIKINGNNLKQRDRNICFLEKKPLESNLFNSLSVMDNILFCADHKLKDLWLNHSVERSLEKNLEKTMGNCVHEKDLLNLSEFELFEVLHQKIIFQKPTLLVLVQPFSFLDMYQRLRNIEYYDQLKKRGVSILILALSLSDTLQVADRLLLGGEGHIIGDYDRKDFSSLSYIHGSLPQ